MDCIIGVITSVDISVSVSLECNDFFYLMQAQTQQKMLKKAQEDRKKEVEKAQQEAEEKRQEEVRKKQAEEEEKRRKVSRDGCHVNRCG